MAVNHIILRTTRKTKNLLINGEEQLNRKKDQFFFINKKQIFSSKSSNFVIHYACFNFKKPIKL